VELRYWTHDIELAIIKMSPPSTHEWVDPASRTYPDPATRAFAGRLGGNQEFILDPKDADNISVLKRVPDASPFISLGDSFNLRGFLEVELWKAAVIEGVGTLLLVWITLFIAAHSSTVPPPAPSPTSGIYSTPIFLGPLVGGITNMIILPLFIYSLGPVSGGHLNPIITMSTFTARLTTFPRMVLYLAFQTAGACIAGLMIRSSFGSRDFLVGGCTIDTSLVPIADIFALEFMADFTLLFLAFGVGLDPRQMGTFGPALGPFLVGVVLGVLSFGTSISRAGYAGASMNPARCMGAFVGSRFPAYAWVVWVAPIVAAVVHGVLYWALPPWAYAKPNSSSNSLA
jgi:glycerol uptake facilitator-like aquaporin